MTRVDKTGNALRRIPSAPVLPTSIQFSHSPSHEDTANLRRLLPSDILRRNSRFCAHRDQCEVSTATGRSILSNFLGGRLPSAFLRGANELPVCPRNFFFELDAYS